MDKDTENVKYLVKKTGLPFSLVKRYYSQYKGTQTTYEQLMKDGPWNFIM